VRSQLIGTIVTWSRWIKVTSASRFDSSQSGSPEQADSAIL